MKPKAYATIPMLELQKQAKLPVACLNRFVGNFRKIFSCRGGKSIMHRDPANESHKDTFVSNYTM
uniref:Uncharacterized protein n=1 Tax=Arundo donax TaxID=35708 RepID=A0A0A8ZFT0_ARUDO